MGTVTPRSRKDGTTAYFAQIAVRRNGKTVRESQTFDREKIAKSWIKKREEELDSPAAFEAAAAGNVRRPRLRHAIQRMIDESGSVGRTKSQVLNSLLATDLSDMECERIASPDIVDLAKQLRKTRAPQTVASYMSQLSLVFELARPAWHLPLEPRVMTDAITVMKQLKLIGVGRRRDRRPTLGELDRLMTHFSGLFDGGASKIPMHKVIAFAIFSTRRLEEITRIKWTDLDETESRVLVRDMKHPEEKEGNDVWVTLPLEAMRIALAMPRVAAEIFPYLPGTVSSFFSDGHRFVEIKDLHFHDFRHEGISRLFELGWNIPHVADVSGHRSWNSLKRYTHIRQKGDKYQGWKWLDVIAPRSSGMAKNL